MKIAEIQGLPEGPINGPVTGHIKFVFEKTEGQYGPSQGIVLMDDSGEITCNIGKYGPFFSPTDKGKTFTVSAKLVNGGPLKGQMSGLKVAVVKGGANAGKKKLNIGSATITVGGSPVAPSASHASGSGSKSSGGVAANTGGNNQSHQVGEREKTIDFWAACKVWPGSKSGNPEDCFNWAIRLLELKDKFISGGVEAVADASKAVVKEELKATEVSGEEFPA